MYPRVYRPAVALVAAGARVLALPPHPPAAARVGDLHGLPVLALQQVAHLTKGGQGPPARLELAGTRHAVAAAVHPQQLTQHLQQHALGVSIEGLSLGGYSQPFNNNSLVCQPRCCAGSSWRAPRMICELWGPRCCASSSRGRPRTSWRTGVRTASYHCNRSEPGG